MVIFIFFIEFQEKEAISEGASFPGGRAGPLKGVAQGSTRVTLLLAGLRIP